MRLLATATALCFLLSQQASAEGRSSVEQVERKPTAQPALQAPAAWPQGTDILTGAPQQLQAPTARPQGPETPTSAQQPLRAPVAARQDYFPLTAAERTGLYERIAECLSIDPGARGEQDIVVE
jgi:hypothetical protein